jgi:hypothetical protein
MPYMYFAPVSTEKMCEHGICENNGAIAIGLLNFRRKAIDKFVEVIDRDTPWRIVFRYVIEF